MRKSLPILIMLWLVAALGTTALAQVGTGGAPPPNVAQPDKFPNLWWSASTSTGVTYDVYRGVNPGGPYGKINGAPISSAATQQNPYRDTSASFGLKNYYAIVAVRTSDGQSSVYSNEVNATAVQGSPAPPTQVNAVVALLEKVGKAIFAVISWIPRHIFG